MADNLMLVGDQQMETTTTLQQRVSAVHAAYRGVMQEGVHYGVIPGTGKKPSLLKPGAEMLCTQFRLVPSYEVSRADLPGGHREYNVTCTLTKLDTGQVWAQGLGLCTTMESKFRYRSRYVNGTRQRAENTDIADTYNTVLKMSKKRALVDATLTATGCSGMFTQDVEDFESPGDASPPPATPSEADRERLASDTASLVALGYKEDEVRAWLWARYKEGGMDAVAVAVASMREMAGGSAQDEQAVEADLYEQDVDF